MEDRLKLAEIKGYVEGCLNKFDEAPTSGPINYFFKDLNAILDIAMDKQSASDKEEVKSQKPTVITLPTDGSQVTHLEYIRKLEEEIRELKHFNEQWQEATERFANKNQKLYKENIELAEKLKLCEGQRNEIYYAHTRREWK